VSIPNPDTVSESGVPARYSIPFFVAPDFSSTIASLPQFETADKPAKYEAMRFDEYVSSEIKFAYQETPA
jgi:isopenicillin N synthase-like dioxygenase